MMAEVVDDGDAVGFATLLLAATDAAEALKASADLVIAQSGEAGGTDAHGGVACIELADHGDLEGGAVDFKPGALRRGAGDGDR